jgi:hypothetical protein
MRSMAIFVNFDPFSTIIAPGTPREQSSRIVPDAFPYQLSSTLDLRKELTFLRKADIDAILDIYR